VTKYGRENISYREEKSQREELIINLKQLRRQRERERERERERQREIEQGMHVLGLSKELIMSDNECTLT